MHEKFHYQSLDELRAAAQREDAWLPLSGDTGALLAPLDIGGRQLPNRIALQPMEGSDGTAGGAPDELTCRRYGRFARGGAALIWFEAVAVAPEARASARQLMLTRQNLAAFRRLTDSIKETALRENGFAPLIVLQATHSGRYSKPQGAPEPLIAYNNPLLEETPLSPERILTDGQLRRYEACFGQTARLAQAAGFDGMDVKCCHRYLASELLSAYTRPGEYGGSFENRARFLLNAYRAARSEVRGSFFLTSRLNVFDGFAYPYGFGVREGSPEPDLAEADRLVAALRREFRIPMINVTIGNPYKNPHVNRPYDVGAYVPDEHPLRGVSRMMRCVSHVQRAQPELPVIGSAFSYPRQFSPNLAAGMVGEGHCAMAGFGRMAFAYPDFPRELKQNGALDVRKVCMTCGQCAQMLRAGLPAGCALRDREVYSL